MQTDEGCSLFPVLSVYSPAQTWKVPSLNPAANGSHASLPSSFAKTRTLKEIFSMLDPGHLGFPSPSVPGDLAAAQCHQGDIVPL